MEGRDPYPPRGPLGWRRLGTHSRGDPREHQTGIGSKRPLLTFIAVWVGGIAAIVGLGFLLPAHIAGVLALVIVIALLSTARI